MAQVIMKNLNKVYPNTIKAVCDFNLEILDKEFIVLVGPSGCGKSTLLRMVAGLEEITQGELFIGEKKVNTLEPKDRDISMVFQNYALYPHMTVYQNMAFGLELRHVNKDIIRKKISEAAELLGISDLLDRKPGQMSGGQQQRVALGRAIVRKPSVFLLDEPLSNLDAKLRNQMRMEIIKLHKHLETTFIYVTHDQTEAMTMADRIVVMNNGYIMQIDTPQNVYNKPANLFVAGFIGTPQMNLIECVIEKSEGRYYAKSGDMKFKLDEARLESGVLAQNEGKYIIMGVRSENIIIGDGDSIGSLELAEIVGSDTYLHLLCGNLPLVAKIASNNKITENAQLKFNIDMEKVHLFNKETGLAL